MPGNVGNVGVSCWLGTVTWGFFFFKRFFYYKPNGFCIQAPDKEAAYWVNSKQLASFRRLCNSGELFAVTLILTHLRSAETITHEPKAPSMPEPSLQKVGCVRRALLAANPGYIIWFIFKSMAGT